MSEFFYSYLTDEITWKKKPNQMYIQDTRANSHTERSSNVHTNICHSLIILHTKYQTLALLKRKWKDSNTNIISYASFDVCHFHLPVMCLEFSCFSFPSIFTRKRKIDGWLSDSAWANWACFMLFFILIAAYVQKEKISLTAKQTKFIFIFCVTLCIA